MAKSRVTVDDRVWRQVKNKMLDKHNVVFVGVIGGAAHKESPDLTVATVASYHEFGGPKNNPPQRSFIRSTLDEKVSKYKKLCRGYVKLIANNQLETPKALGLLGAEMVSDMKLKIESNIAPPLSEITLERKRVNGREGNVALVDTGQLIGSINFQVKGEGGDAI